jgi:two-component system chemotaxis sensor kinase CheA
MADSPVVRDEFFDALLGDFLDESGQLLDRLNSNLLQLDEWVRQLDDDHRQCCDAELLNEMFRAAHSLKGLSAMLGLGDINTLTHKVENVFDAARKDELRVSGHVVELMFQAIDRLGGMVHGLKDADAEAVDASDVAHDIQQLLQSAGCERQVTSQADAERALQVETDPLAAADAILPPSSLLAEGPADPTDAVEAADAVIDHFADLTDDIDTMSKYLPIFIDEADLSLDELTETLLTSEGNGNRETIEKLLVTSHRLKGAAASVGLNRAAKLSHLMEDAMQELLQVERSVTPAVADALLRCIDALRQYVAALKNGQTPPAEFNPLAADLLAAMGTTVPAAVSAPPCESMPAAQIDGAPIAEDIRQQVRAATKEPERTLVGRVVFQSDLALVGLKARLVYEKIANLGEVVYFDPPLENLDELDSIEAVHFGLVGDRSAGEVQRKANVAGIAHWQIAALVEHAAPASPAATAGAASAKQSRAAAPTDDAAAKTRVADASKPNETLRVDIERLDQLMNLAGQLVINKARFAKIGEQLRTVTITKRCNQVFANVGTALSRISEASRARTDAGHALEELQAAGSAARRAQQELDSIRSEIEGLAQVRGTINDLFETIHQLDRVTDAIQQSVMDTRMLPIGPLFTRFKRVIRDITRANGKQINLVINGEKTELDKRMIDELGDPLIHMVRNSADHGIEPPEVRAAAGKPLQGTITLDAFHRGNTIVIQVTDDGKGLEVERIREKAIERGLISAADAEKMTRHQLYQLIWEPGLSTAEKVTDISGRGMGMDIVRSKIEELNGAIELDSEPGRGTQITVKLPLTLAILPSLMVEIDGDVFAMPVEGVQEIVRVGRNESFSVHQQRVARVRGRVIATVVLSDVFTWAQGNRARSESEETTLVVVGEPGREVGLAVDRVIGEEDIVIKSMAENYRNVAGVAGASVLGDGRVSLILDLPALIDMAARRAAATARETGALL